MHLAQQLVQLGLSSIGGPNSVSAIRNLAKHGGPLAELLAVFVPLVHLGLAGRFSAPIELSKVSFVPTPLPFPFPVPISHFMMCGPSPPSLFTSEVPVPSTFEADLGPPVQFGPHQIYSFTTYIPHTTLIPLSTPTALYTRPFHSKLTPLSTILPTYTPASGLPNPTILPTAKSTAYEEFVRTLLGVMSLAAIGIVAGGSPPPSSSGSEPAMLAPEADDSPDSYYVAFPSPPPPPPPPPAAESAPALKPRRRNWFFMLLWAVLVVMAVRVLVVNRVKIAKGVEVFSRRLAVGAQERFAVLTSADLSWPPKYPWTAQLAPTSLPAGDLLRNCTAGYQCLPTTTRPASVFTRNFRPDIKPNDVSMAPLLVALVAVVAFVYDAFNSKVGPDYVTPPRPVLLTPPNTPLNRISKRRIILPGECIADILRERADAAPWTPPPSPPWVGDAFASAVLQAPFEEDYAAPITAIYLIGPEPFARR